MRATDGGVSFMEPIPIVPTSIIFGTLSVAPNVSPSFNHGVGYPKQSKLGRPDPTAGDPLGCD